MYTQFDGRNAINYYNREDSYFKMIVDALPITLMTQDQRDVFEILCNSYFNHLKPDEKHEIIEVGKMFREKAGDAIKAVAEINYHAYIYKIIFGFYDREKTFKEMAETIKKYVEYGKKNLHQDFYYNPEDYAGRLR